MATYDVLTIGNAIVDIISRCDDDFLIDNAITKGAMNLIDAERAELLYSRMGPAVEASGGSATMRIRPPSLSTHLLIAAAAGEGRMKDRVRPAAAPAARRACEKILFMASWFSRA